MLSNLCYGKDNVAVAGNSIAANLAWYNQIDLCEKASSMFTKHAVAGDGVNSSGIPNYFEFGGFTYNAGEGRNNIRSIIEDSYYCDYVIFVSGTNELLCNLQENPEYYNREGIIISEYIEILRRYLDKINPKCKIILFTIPKVITYSDKEELSRQKWNKAIIDLAKNYKNVSLEDFNDLGMRYLDYIHFTSDSYMELYQFLTDKYGINR